MVPQGGMSRRLDGAALPPRPPSSGRRTSSGRASSSSPLRSGNRRTSEPAIKPFCDSFISAEGVNLDSRELEVTGDDTVGDVSDEERCLQNGLFLLEPVTK
jgi:hypothetical protein